MKLSLKSIDFLPADLDNYIILLSAPLLLSIYYYNGRAGMFLHYFPSFNGNDYADVYSFYWQFGIFFILMGLLHFLYLLNKKTRLKRGTEIFETVITGVEANGTLQTRDLIDRSFVVNEVSWILKNESTL